jgi:ABC-2 type transport system ATP-binding protein
MDEVEYLCDRVAVMVRGRFVAVDSVSALIRRYAGDGARLVAEDVGDDWALRADLDRLGPGIRVTPAGNRLQIDVSDPTLVSTVDTLLAGRRVGTRRINASLEDVYLTLTGEASPTGVTADVR